MRTNNKIFSFMSAILLLAILVSWKGTDGQVGAEVPLSGEQAFREIIFFEGTKMQNDVPEYSRFKRIAEERSSPDGKSFEDFKSFTISLIKKKDPTYFQRFQTIIQKDNPYEVKELLTSSLTAVSIAQVLFDADAQRRVEYENAISSRDFTGTSSVQDDLKNILDMYRVNNPNYKKAALSAAPIIYHPGIPDLVFVYFPPCSIVAVCAIVYYMDAKTSTDESTLLTEKISNAIIKNY